jgi:hypothetical protein
LNHVVIGNKSMYFFVKTLLSNVSVASLHVGLRIGTIGIERSLSSRPGSRLHIGVLTDKVVHILVITFSTNVLHWSLGESLSLR